jgi:hypothetical protein
MKKNNIIQSFIIFLIGIVLISTSISCTVNSQLSNKTTQKIVVYTHCASQEASSDILNSIDKNSDQLKKKGIFVILDYKKNLCGYLLIDRTKTKKITGVLTDFDLSQEVDNFYK